MAWKPVAIVGLAVALAAAMIAVLPASPRRTVRVAEAAGSCPITIRVHGSSSPTLPSIAGATRAQFEPMWAPGTTVAIAEMSGANGIADLTAGNADIAIATRPLTNAESAGKYEWQIADHVWVATRDTATVNRIDNSLQVRADDWINFIRHLNVSFTGGLGYTGAIPPAPADPFPDWDVNLDGNTSLGDLGAVASRWGLTGCYGWIRADGNNSAGVSLGDIGTVTHHWGQLGFICNAWTRCCTQGVVCSWTDVFKAKIRGYAYDQGCAEGIDGNADPITVVVRQRNSVDADLGTDGFAHTAGFPPATVYGLLDIHDDPIEAIGGIFEDPGTWFYDGGACIHSEILRDDTEGHERCWRLLSLVECLKSRLHVRGHRQFLVPDSYPGVSDTPLTPHFDTAIDPCHQGACQCDDQHPPFVYRKHIVHTNGFNDARNRLEYEWVVASGRHFIIESQNWLNTNPRRQCNGELAEADGMVDILGTCGEIAVC